jgi:hypothetical protein
VGGLAQAKSNLDSGIFQAVQEAGIEALKLGDSIVEPSRKIYPGTARYSRRRAARRRTGMRQAARNVLCLGRLPEGPHLGGIHGKAVWTKPVS